MNIRDCAMVFIVSTIPGNDSFESLTQARKEGRRVKKGERHRSYENSPT